MSVDGCLDSPLERSITNKTPNPPAHRSLNYGHYSPNLPKTPNCPNPKVPKLSAGFYTSSVCSNDPSFFISFLIFVFVRHGLENFFFVLSIRIGRFYCASNRLLWWGKVIEMNAFDLLFGWWRLGGEGVSTLELWRIWTRRYVAASVSTNLISISSAYFDRSYGRPRQSVFFHFRLQIASCDCNTAR